ncbi:ATP-binding protein [Sorangium sp. So ce1128]
MATGAGGIYNVLIGTFPGRSADMAKSVVVARLGEESDRARLYRLRRARPVAVPGQEHDRQGAPPARELVLQLEPEDFERVFEPFFTTKTQRLGVGLSISRSIVEAHGGWLWAECSPGEGATLRCALPVWDEGARRTA